MTSHSKLYDTAEDRQWLCDTALRGYDMTPDRFGSFTIAGHEDCPLEIRLYHAEAPLVTDEPIAEYELRQNEQDTLSRYHVIWPWQSKRR